MPNVRYNLSHFWKTKTKEILEHSRLSVAKKILLYKIFLRPMLIFEWFEGRDNEMKNLEIQALRRIFVRTDINRLYKRYTDIDVTRYIKLQEIRWRRATGSDFGSLRRMLQELSKTGDPSPYFTRARRVSKHHCRCGYDCRCRHCINGQCRHHRHSRSVSYPNSEVSIGTCGVCARKKHN